MRKDVYAGDSRALPGDGAIPSCGRSPFFLTEEELPQDFPASYRAFTHWISMDAFSIRARMMAALALAEAFSFASAHPMGWHRAICMEDVYLHGQTGEIKILVGRDEDGEEGPEDADRPSILHSGFSGESMARFAAYLAFWLLFKGDPFDGKKTLVEFPYLSRAAVKEISSGKRGLVVADGENAASPYIGREICRRWNAVPGFFRERMQCALNGGPLAADGWLYTMRRLRDCLVIDKTQFRFYDMEMPVDCLCMATEKYRIPVCPKKALYGYHVGIEADPAANGMIAGVDAEGALENDSAFPWSVEYGKQKRFIDPKESIVPKEGMSIVIKDTVIRIVRGDSMPEADSPRDCG